jgi:hypothetical protein
MPYLHWESKPDYETMRALIKSKEVKGVVLPPTTGEQDRFLKLLDKNRIQIRRSLDQSYYWSLTSTEKRDKEQVVDRYARNYAIKAGSHSHRPLLMVDQIWIWVLNEGGNKGKASSWILRKLPCLTCAAGTIVSFFPHVWHRQMSNEAGLFSNHDPLDVFEEISKYLKSDRAEKCRNPLKLVIYMLDRCAGNLLDEHPELPEDRQYIEHFNRSIDILVMSMEHNSRLC